MAFTIAEVVVLLVPTGNENLRQDVHQGDIGQCADRDEQSETCPPVERLSAVRVIDAGLALRGEHGEGDKGAEWARDCVGLGGAVERGIRHWGRDVDLQLGM